MPKEQPRLDDKSRRSSSKNAKDKSNIATLLASQAPADSDQSNGRGSYCSSEKDSGYSDNGSDWQQTDGEDQRSTVSEPRGRESVKGQGWTEEPPHQGKYIKVQGNSELTPVYVLKNVVLKKPVAVSNGNSHLIQSQLTWSNTGGANTSGPTHVMLLQPPSMTLPLASSPKLRKPPSRRTNRKTKGSYLPILKSYPRIAPHPSKKVPGNLPACLGKVTGSEGNSLNRRDKRDDVSNSTNLQIPKHHLHKQPESSVQSLQYQHFARSPSSPSMVYSSQGSPSVSSSEISTLSSSYYSSSNSSSPLPASRGPRNSVIAHHRRFLNTLEILSQSGLLDITLRTKDLLCQSNATERDIAQLRQHTQLLCQAANSANDSTGNATWERLHQAMVESGVYPSLECLDEVGVLHNPEDFIKLNGMGSVGANTTRCLSDSAARPSPLVVPELGPPQNCPMSHNGMLNGMSALPVSEHGWVYKARAKPSESLTFTPPDSSTHRGVH